MSRPNEKRFNLVECFDALALAGKKPNLVERPNALTLDDKTTNDKKHPAIGGNPFVDPFITPPCPPVSRGRGLPQAVNTNAHQQSLTTKYALKLLPNTPSRSPLARPFTVVSPPSISEAPVRPTPRAAPNKPRSVSAPHNTKSSLERCSGLTRTGSPCARTVKVPELFADLHPTPELYCHQHRDASQRGFYLPKAGGPEKFVEFDHYIPKYLKMDTQMALRKEMTKATTAADEAGFIYAFEVLDSGREDVIELKVGRAVNLNKRLDEWDKQCPSRAHIPRGWWPRTVEGGASPLKGNIRTGKPGPFCHRVERLVHIELADLSLHAPYLDPEWPDISCCPTPEKKRVVKAKNCSDCGKAHREIFTFRRPDGGKYKGREWETIVRPVIEKWGRFVKDHYA